jgi:SAM-dependent methyltransferase
MTKLPDPTRHLDLGCGYAPRNPLNQTELFGCDLLDFSGLTHIPRFEYRKTDLVRSGIPFPDSFFNSVSAFDFLEHIPRHSVDEDCNPVSPFISLMNEIYRVLIPGGVFVASTPAYPHAQAFQDPTHVNIITNKTHEYFCGSDPYAARYGFTGHFRAQRIAFELQKNIYDHKASKLRKLLRNSHRKWFKGGLPHLTWILIADKQQ